MPAPREVARPWPDWQAGTAGTGRDWCANTSHVAVSFAWLRHHAEAHYRGPLPAVLSPGGSTWLTGRADCAAREL